MGRKRGVATLLKESLPWFEIVHCFNHRLELALKDAFQDIRSFQMIDEMLKENLKHFQTLWRKLYLSQVKHMEHAGLITNFE